jgi:serine phosphatase RsbU (regulator of sigma subunit)/ABC-type transporter Mla MlaB component
LIPLEDVRTLVVDDDAVTRLLVRSVLEGAGCEVREAVDGVEAQDALSSQPDIELVITDIVMPRLDGLELLSWARARGTAAAWIILSGQDTFDAAAEAVRLGAYDFLVKPPQPAALEVAARNAVEQQRLLRERDRLLDELGVANDELRHKVREVEEKSDLLRRDLARAEIIQRALLPHAPPEIEHFCVQSVYRPGRYVGGDLYDVCRLDARHVVLYVADATGHGVTAAMLSVLFKNRLTMVDEATGAPLAPAEVLAAANRALVSAVDTPGLFLTAAYCLLDTETGMVRLASAGHPPVVHATAAGETRLLRRTGPALGLSTAATYDETGFRFGQGDRLLLYTDGLFHEGGSLDAERLGELLRSEPAADDLLGELLRMAAESNAAAAGSVDDPDDVTALLLDVRAGASRFDNGAAAERTGDAPESGAGVARGSILVGDGDGTVFLALRGRVTWLDCYALHQAAFAVLDERLQLVLDLAACEHLDSTGLGTLHELVERGARVQNASPQVRALFEELRLDAVLAATDRPPEPLPQMLPLAAALDADAGRERVLHAHEALASVSDENRARFRAVIEALRG